MNGIRAGEKMFSSEESNGLAEFRFLARTLH